jgi:uncharacterized protein (TIGR02594 family)
VPRSGGYSLMHKVHIDRRQILKWSAASTTFGLVPTSKAYAQASLVDYDIGPDRTEPYPTWDEISAASRVLGTGVTQEDLATAANIELNAPTATTPSAVAKYFLDVREGRYPAAWIPFSHAWAANKPANPMIVKFFEATDVYSWPIADWTKLTDTVPWCSAFVNWCIERSRKNRPGAQLMLPRPSKLQASSSSFRDWGPSIRASEFSPNNMPSIGDIVVFADASNGKLDPNQGHVGFVMDLDFRRQKIKVLGGNQMNPERTHYAVCEVWFSWVNPTKVLYSFCTDSSLH